MTVRKSQDVRKEKLARGKVIRHAGTNSQSPEQSPEPTQSPKPKLQQELEQEQLEDVLFTELLAKYQKALCNFGDFCALDVKPREALIGKWMREGDTGFVFGQRGSGKTWLLDLLLSHLTTGAILIRIGTFPKNAVRS